MSLRGIIGRVAVCVVVLAASLALALIVGDADYHATSVGWVPFVSVLVLFAVAFVSAVLLKRGLSFEGSASQEGLRHGETAVFTTRFSNRTPLFQFRIESRAAVLDMYGGSVVDTPMTLALAPFESQDVRFKARFEHVGTYQAGMHHVVVCDFLRLLKFRVPGDTMRSVHVLPRVVEIGQVPFSSVVTSDAMPTNRAVLADSLDYASVRDYAVGDPLKTVHWKLSARMGSFMTKLFEVYDSPGVSIVMDFHASAGEAASEWSVFDAVVESAFSLFAYASSKGVDVELRYVDKDGVARSYSALGEEESYDVVESLPLLSAEAAVNAQTAELLTSIAHAKSSKNNVFVCSGDVSEEMASRLVDMKLSGKNPVLFSVVPPNLSEREVEDCCAPLAQLDASDVRWMPLSCVEELQGVAMR